MMDYKISKKEDFHINLTIQIFNIKDKYKVSEIINKLQGLGYLKEIGGSVNSNNTIVREFILKEEN
jgi:hypothetical protein